MLPSSLLSVVKRASVILCYAVSSRMPGNEKYFKLVLRHCALKVVAKRAQSMLQKVSRNVLFSAQLECRMKLS